MKLALSQKPISLLLLAILFFIWGCKKAELVASVNPSKDKIIYFNNIDHYVSFDIYAAYADGYLPRKTSINLPNNVRLQTVNIPVLSADRATVFFNAFNVNADGGSGYCIYSANINGSNISQIIHTPDYSIVSMADTYADKILFSEEKALVHGSQLWLAGVDGSNPRQINIGLDPNYDIENLSAAKFSFDGNSIFFWAFDNMKLSANLFHCNLDGSGLTKIFTYPHPDNSTRYTLLGNLNINRQSKVLLSSTVNPSSILVLNADGSASQTISFNITPHFVVAEAPVKLSADGQTMYFSGGRLTDPINIYGCNLDGSNPQLAITPGMSSAGVYIGAIY